jgi:GT2 family glycosyltransferase
MQYSGSFNFSKMNNAAIKKYGMQFEFVLFMNNDVEATRKGWLERLMSLAARPDVGAVGPALLFSDRKIQHAGVIIGYEDAAEHVGKFVGFEDDLGSRTDGANCTLTSVRDFSAVTAACLMMRTAVFREIGGYREELAVAFNDTDLCLRVRERGYRVLYDGHVFLYHHESATRAHTNDLVHPHDTELFQATWHHLMNGRDPFYNPALSLTVQDHVLADRLSVAPALPRVVTLWKERP